MRGRGAAAECCGRGEGGEGVDRERTTLSAFFKEEGEDETMKNVDECLAPSETRLG